jgi:acyl-CoA thioester hydrolase
MTGSTDPAAYRFWIEERVRFADIDALGHINNNAYGVYIEGCRFDFFRAIGLADPASGKYGVLARIEIDYRGETLYGANVRVGLRVAKIGRTSFTLESAVFDGDRCVATSSAVQVRMDTATRRPTELTEDEKARLAAYA